MVPMKLQQAQLRAWVIQFFWQNLPKLRFVGRISAAHDKRHRPGRVNAKHVLQVEEGHRHIVESMPTHRARCEAAASWPDVHRNRYKLQRSYGNLQQHAALVAVAGTCKLRIAVKFKKEQHVWARVTGV